MWNKNGGNPQSNDTNTPSGNGPYGGNDRNSVTSDDNTKRSTNVPFSGYGIKKGAYKPQFAQDIPKVNDASGIHSRLRGGRFGQGGFARVFQNQNKPNVGAAASGPRGALTGIFGY